MAAKHYITLEQAFEHGGACSLGRKRAIKEFGPPPTKKILVNKKNFMRIKRHAGYIAGLFLTWEEDVAGYIEAYKSDGGNRCAIKTQKGRMDKYADLTWEAIKRKLSINDKGEAV